jgi:hypothetical protein
LQRFVCRSGAQRPRRSNCCHLHYGGHRTSTLLVKCKHDSVTFTRLSVPSPGHHHPRLHRVLSPSPLPLRPQLPVTPPTPSPPSISMDLQRVFTSCPWPPTFFSSSLLPCLFATLAPKDTPPHTPNCHNFSLNSLSLLSDAFKIFPSALPFIKAR